MVHNFNFGMRALAVSSFDADELRVEFFTVESLMRA
jgi:hypothetical protein